MPRALKQRENLCILNLFKLLIPLADRFQLGRRFHKDRVVRFAADAFRCLSGGDRRSDNHPGSACRLRRPQRCEHRGARGKAVIDENHRFAAQLKRPCISPIDEFTPLHFNLLPLCDLLELLIGNGERPVCSLLV